MDRTLHAKVLKAKSHHFEFCWHQYRDKYRIYDN